MSDWLTTRQLQHLQRGYRKRVETPIPTQVVSSGECFPPPQSRRQAQAKVLMREKTDFYAGRQGMPRQRYLRSPSGMAAAFMAMNQVYGDVYRVDPAELALLSTSPSVDPEKTLLSDRQMVATRDQVNEIAGTRRMFAHGVIWPSAPEYLALMEPAATELKVDSWKGYTIGDVLGYHPTFDRPWRLDDEELTWPTYEKARQLGVRNICIHKGVLPIDYERLPNWQYASVEDVGGAAAAWPDLNFHIYHAGLKMWRDAESVSEEFERTGRLAWIDELAAIPAEYGVSNVYADIGLSFGALAITHPRLAAAMVAKLVKGLGVDHVLWGTDSIWFGSPQWQIEAFRRIELPPDLQDKLDLAPLGPADGPVKNAIFGINAAGQYDLALDTQGRPVTDYVGDALSQLKAAYLAAGNERDNLFWGWVHKE